MALFRCRVNHCSHFARNKELEVQMQLQIWLEIPYIPVHVSSDNKRYHRNYRNQNEGENWQNREPAQKEGSDNKAWGKTQLMSKQRDKGMVTRMWLWWSGATKTSLDEKSGKLSSQLFMVKKTITDGCCTATHSKAISVWDWMLKIWCLCWWQSYNETSRWWGERGGRAGQRGLE